MAPSRTDQEECIVVDGDEAPGQGCHPNWSNDSYSKIFLRINVGPKKTSSDNCTKKELYKFIDNFRNNFKFDIYSKKIYLLP